MNLTSVLVKPRMGTLMKNILPGKNMPNIKDRVKGVLLGLASGDQIGGPTSMALILSNSLIEHQTLNEEDVRLKYLNWYKQEGFDTGIVSKMVFKSTLGGVSMPEAVEKVDYELSSNTAGCNPVHRNAVLSMLNAISDTKISSVVIKESALTHKHYLAGHVAACSAELIRMLINGVTWKVAISRLENISSPVMSKIIRNGLNGEIYSDGYSPHVLSAAIHFVNSSDTFDNTLIRSIEFSGDENYCSILAGSLGGARWGLSSISKYWLKGISSVEQIKLESTADKLSKGW